MRATCKQTGFIACVAFIVCAMSTLTHAADQIPGAPQAKPIALTNATIHPVTGPTIRKGTLIFADGRIVALGADAAIPDGAQRINLKGKHVYPGLIDAYTDMGLIEINAVRATRDQSETGRINPNVKANVAVKPDGEVIPVARSNGVLLTLTVPRGGLINGQSALLQLDGWTYEDLTVASPVGVHVDWPRMTPAPAWYDKSPAKDQIAQRDKALAELEQAFDDARAYLRARQAAKEHKRPMPDRDARWEGMIPLLERRVPMIVRADELAEIQAAVAFAVRQNVRVAIFGGYDAPHCAELLKTHDVPVIIAGAHRLPRRRHEGYDLPFTLPKRLQDAGVTWCLSGAYRFGASMVRNLPYHAASAAAYGLPRDAAIKSITL